MSTKQTDERRWKNLPVTPVLLQGAPMPAEQSLPAMLSQIVIEAEAPRNSQTMLRLSIDTHLIAERLTAAQAQLLVGEILDRIAVAEVGKDAGEH